MSQVPFGILIPLLVFAFLYAEGRRAGDGISGTEEKFYWAGWIALVVALVSPLHEASEELFSLHMLQHEIVMVVAAPMLVLGRPLVRYLWAVPLPARRMVGGFSPVLRTLTGPAVAGILHAAAIWVWHYPPWFQATISNDWAHAAQHLSFFLTALLFWWSVFHSGSGPAMLNLLAATIHTGVLGALLVFSRAVIYPGYAGSAVEWHTTALRDQQLGGLIMWVPGGLSYLAAGLWLASRSLAPSRV